MTNQQQDTTQNPPAEQAPPAQQNPPAPEPTTPAVEPDRAPSIGETMAAARAGAEAIQPGMTTQQAREAVAGAVQEELAKYQVRLPDDERNAIAAATIAQLEARGAFVDGHAVEETIDDAPAAETPATAETPPPAEAPPHRPTFAERFLGDRG